MQRIYNMLASILGESKQGGYDKSMSQYQFNCPWCTDEKGGIDNKYNLEVSFTLGKYHCWSCGHAGPLSRLVKDRGGKEMADEYFRLINDIKENRYYNLDMFKDNEGMFSDEYLKLPKTYQKIDIKSCRDKQLVEYIGKRGITQDIIDEYSIGYTTWDEEDWTWRNRIIFPSYNSVGDLNYYIGRSYRENDKRVKYKNCKADKNKIVFHEDKIQWDADICLVEGVIDGIYAPNTVSLMGKVLNKNGELYRKITERANANVIICLDGDTTDNETKKVYMTLRRCERLRDKHKIKYIKLGGDDLPWKDFGEIYESKGKSGIIKALKSAKEYSELEIS